MADLPLDETIEVIIRDSATSTNEASVDANGALKVDGSRNQASSAAVSRLASSNATQQLVAANTNRKGLLFYNDSTGQQFIKFGTTASQTDFTVRLTTQSYYEVPFPVYTGRMDIICTNNNGGIQITELS